MTQKPYLRDRLIEDTHDGFVVIVPVGASAPVPLSCPLCKYVMRSRDDELAYFEFECCDRCARLWAQSRKIAWKDGWRPTPAQIAAAEADRMPLTLLFDVD